MSPISQQRPLKRRAKDGSGPRKPRKKCFPRLGRQRRQANQRERVRAQRITDAVDELRSVLWKDERTRKGKSIILTLRTALDYIKLLQKTAEGEALSETESDLHAFELLEKYCREDLLTTSTSRPVAVSPPVRPDSLKLEHKMSSQSSSTRPNSAESLSSSGYSSCSSSSGKDNLDLSDCNLDDLLLDDLPEMADFSCLLSGPIDFLHLLSSAECMG